MRYGRERVGAEISSRLAPPQAEAAQKAPTDSKVTRAPLFLRVAAVEETVAAAEETVSAGEEAVSVVEETAAAVA